MVYDSKTKLQENTDEQSYVISQKALLRGHHQLFHHFVNPRSASLQEIM